jgi:amino acid adenylation domain-containing protein
MMSFTSCIIGSGQLPLQCGQILLDKGHQVVAIISSDTTLLHWAIQNKIPHTTSFPKNISFQFDYLFSIVNENKLLEQEIALAKKAAINYHDGPLPRYAGMHVTSWAILNGEISHGVTWHVMSSVVDAGDTLEQVFFPIEENETALSLNAKCYQAAVTSFSELIDNLSQNKCTRTVQSLSDRTFFSLKQKPTGNGLIDWSEPAYAINQKYRACYFGDHDNRLSCLKLLLHGQCFVVAKLSLLTAKSSILLKPGEIISVKKNAIEIATSKGLIAIEEIAYITGRPLSIGQWAKLFHLKPGDILPSPHQDISKSLEKFSTELFQYEAYWIQKLSSTSFTTLPFFSKGQKLSTRFFRNIFSVDPIKFNKNSLETLLLAVVAAYLYRITNNKMQTIGYAPDSLSGYPSPFFAKILPFNLSLNGQQDFTELQHVIKQHLEMIKKQKTYLKDVSLRYMALKDNSIFTENFPIVFHTNSHGNDANFKIEDKPQLVITLDSNKATYTLELRANSKEATQAQGLLTRIGQHLQQLMYAVCADPKQSLQQLPLLPTGEKNWLLERRGIPTIEGYWLKKTIPDIFNKIALQYSNRIAVACGNSQLTYAELNEKSDLVASILLDNGVKPQQRVAVYLSRSLEAIIAFLAILKAGAVYVPIDPEYPDLRTEYILKDASVSLVLTLDQYCQKFKRTNRNDISLSVLSITEMMKKHVSIRTPVRTDSLKTDDLAYILYTSGSTGEPKGVAVTCLGIIRLVKCQPYFTPTPLDTLLQTTKLSFDVSMFEIWGSLLNGAQLMVFADKVLDPYLLAEKIKTAHPIVSLTPSVFNQIISLLPTAFDNAKSLILAGEVVEPVSVRSLLQRKQQYNLKIQIVNAYGPTENTIISSWYLIDEITHLQDSIPIGKPVAGTTVYVLDEQLQLVPIGVPGELCLGGLGLSPGYLNKPELNASVFFANPYNLSEDEILYKTGDIVKWREDGNLDYLRRRDSQIKLRGLRIELSEIEIQIKKLPHVQEVIVLLDKQNQCLVAYVRVDLVLSETGKSSFLLKIRQALETFLPNYMVPTEYHLLPQFPLTVNGKVDRNALLTLNRESDKAHLAYAQPRTRVEKQLARIYKDLLGIKQVGLYDSFFKLGGHSLLAMALIAKINAEFNVHLPFHRLFDLPSIHQLANYIETASISGLREDIIPILPLAQAAPLSFAQESLWLFEQLNLDTSTYNIPLLIELKGELDEHALQQALNILVERHPILRTRFCLQGDEVVQQIMPSAEINLVRYNRNNIKIGLKQFIRTLAQSTFTVLDNAALIRAYLITVRENEYQLLINFHHMISDLQSCHIFYQEISALYNAYSKGEFLSLPVLSLQYKDYSHWQRQVFKERAIKANLDYWQKQMGNLPLASTLTPDHPRPPIQRYVGKTYRVALQKSIIASLQQEAAENESTLFMMLLSAFFILLRHYTQQEDIIIGVPLSGRHIKGTENILGMFVTMLPIRLKFSSSFGFMEVLQHIKSTMLEAHTYQDIPFYSLVEMLNIPASLNQNPIFQITFNFQQTIYKQPKFDGLATKSTFIDTGTAKFDLSLDIVQQGTKFYAHCEYNTDLFDTTTIHGLMDNFQCVLQEITKDPHFPANRYVLLDEKNRKKILVDWNNTAKNYSTNQLPQQLFEAQVLRTPLAPAVIFAGKVLSYWTLNQQANHIAQALINHGVGPEQFVVLYLERSPAMIVAILAVLKAGGVYVPIEPGYPQNRLQHIISEVKPALLLTHEQLNNSLFDFNVPIINMDDIDNFMSCAYSNPIPALSLDNAISVIYTSGSTGKPKGVINLYRGALNHLHWMQEIYHLNEQDRVLQKTTYMFDASFVEIFLPLISGASLILPGPNEHKDIYRIIELIEEYQISLIQFVPSQLAVFLEALRPGECTSLKYVWCGGEPLHRNLCNQFLKRCHAQLHHLYGATEASDDTTHWLCRKVMPGENVLLGKPIANVQCFVLDKYLNPLPIGVPGELYIGGAGLARGYLNQPELTAAAFIAHPFLKEAGAQQNSRLYKTGDIVKWLSTGELVFIGRMDHQVKVHGFRIELSEIEAAILKYPVIRQTVVLVKENNSKTTRLIAYIVVKSQTAVLESALKDFLNSQLPRYMIPSQFIIIPRIPLTATGKLDRSALMVLQEQVKLPSDKFPLHGTPTEEKLKGIWTLLLQRQSIAVEDDFFNLGGHSLAAARLMIHIQREFGIKLPLASLFKHSTLYELGRLIDTSLLKESIPSSLVEIFPSKLKTIKAHLKQTLPACFFVHPLGGSIFCYRLLAEALADCMQGNLYRPFYAFEAKGLSSSELPGKSIGELARNYLLEMREVQKKGPYIIGGWSFGGIVAAEMVRQLEHSGEEVLALILIDTTAEFKNIKNVDHADDEKLLEFYEKLFNIKVKKEINNLSEGLIRLIENGTAASTKHYTPGEIEQLLNVVRSNIKALENFELSAINAKTFLIKAEKTEHNAPASGWDKYALKQPYLYTVAGANHWTILEVAFIQETASIINGILSQTPVTST